MKSYEKPVLEISEFNNRDIITASGLNLFYKGTYEVGENEISFGAL